MLRKRFGESFQKYSKNENRDTDRYRNRYKIVISDKYRFHVYNKVESIRSRPSSLDNVRQPLSLYCP